MTTNDVRMLSGNSRGPKWCPAPACELEWEVSLQGTSELALPMLRMLLRTLNRSQVERQGKPAMPGVPMKERRSVLSYRHVDALSKASGADPLCIDGIDFTTGARGIDDRRRSWCRDFADQRKQHS